MSEEYRAKLAKWVETQGTDLEDFEWPFIRRGRISDWKDLTLTQPTEQTLSSISVTESEVEDYRIKVDDVNDSKMIDVQADPVWRVLFRLAKDVHPLETNAQIRRRLKQYAKR